ncbi:hypothetical protein BJX99DRAFT_99536 [Aspergillus californicus]
MWARGTSMLNVGWAKLKLKAQLRFLTDIDDFLSVLLYILNLDVEALACREVVGDPDRRCLKVPRGIHCQSAEDSTILGSRLVKFSGCSHLCLAHFVFIHELAGRCLGLDNSPWPQSIRSNERMDFRSVKLSLFSVSTSSVVAVSLLEPDSRFELENPMIIKS